jgi:hypothetical protein
MFLTLVYGDLGFCGCICLHILVLFIYQWSFQALDCYTSVFVIGVALIVLGICIYAFGMGLQFLNFLVFYRCIFLNMDLQVFGVFLYV